jgi:hypothetical protein
MQTLRYAIASVLLLAAGLAGCGSESVCGNCASGEACVQRMDGVKVCATLCSDGGTCANATETCATVEWIPPAPSGVDTHVPTVAACVQQ